MDRRSLLALAGATGLCGFSPSRPEQCRRDGEFPDGVRWYAVWAPRSEGGPADTIYFSYNKMMLDEDWLKLSIVGAYDRFMDGRTEVSLLKVDATKNLRGRDMPAVVRANLGTSYNGRPSMDIRYIFNVGARELRTPFPMNLETDPDIGPQQVDRERQEAAKRLAIDYWDGTPMRIRVLTGPDNVVVRDITVPTLDFSPDRLAAEFRALRAESRTRVCTRY